MAQAPDGANARSYLQSRLRLGSSVTLRPQTVDRYGRTVAEVIGEINLGLAMGRTAWPLPTSSSWITATPESIWMPS
jgi:endonuclease YncB( thermonuclease family)